MAETPRLDLPYLSASQAQKEVMHNVSLDRLDLLVQCAVLDRNLTTPPVSPGLGDAYIVAATGTGAWAGHDNHLALWISSQWQFIAPLPGFTCWVNDESVLIYWSGTGWVIASGGGGSTTFLGLSDTPDSYTGQAGKAVLVNAGGTALEFGTTGGGAPVDATYIVSGANATLTAERVLTNSASLTWNTGTPGQVSADIPAGGVTLDQLAPLAFPTLLGRGNPPTGNVEPISVGAGLTLTAGTLALSSAPGAADFLSLTDTPDSYSGQAGKVVAVNSGATALEFITGGGGSYTDEQAQDAVGSILTDSATLDFTYDDATPSITGIVKDASITEAKLVLADVTTQDVSTTRHGLVPKAPNVATQYLDGTGAWSTPAGGGGYTDEQAQDAVGAMFTSTASISFSYNDAVNVVTAQVIAEAIQDIVGPMLVDSSTIDFTYNDALGTETADVKDASITEAKVVLADNTTHNVTTTRHGLVPKAPNSATQFLDGTGAWSTPAGGAATFLALTDTPDAYTSNALKLLRVNAAATAVEFGDVLGTMATQNADAVAITGGTATLSTVTINSSLGIGTPATVYPVFLRWNKGVAHAIAMQPLDSDAGSTNLLFMNLAGSVVGSIGTTAAATAFNTSSDVRLKHAIAPLTGALERVRALRPVSHRWNVDDSPGEGFLAHELMVPCPLAVSGLPDEVNPDGSVKPQQVDLSRLVPLLTAGLQAALAQIDALTTRISTLEEQLGI